MVDANVGYITLNSSSRPIYKTTNGGTNWTAVTTPFTGQIRAVHAVDANLVYLGINSGTNRVGKSIDGGATWQQIALPATVMSSASTSAMRIQDTWLVKLKMPSAKQLTAEPHGRSRMHM